MSRKWLLVAIPVLFSGSLGAVTTYGPAANYTVGLDGIYSGIGEVSGSNSSCSGSLIAANIVLTAAHCLQPNMTVTFADASGSPVYTVVQQIADPNYTTGYDDVALLVLNTDVSAGITIYSLNTDTNPVDFLGATITVAGYGYGGQGMEMTGYGTLRAGLNTIEGIWPASNSNAFAFTFNNGSAQQYGQEGFTCYGDSGGPSFLGNTLGSSSITPEIIGIHDFISSSTSQTPTCSFGETAGDQSVALFIPFITTEEAIIESAPEPGTLVTLATGLGVLILGRRRMHDTMIGSMRTAKFRRNS